jgi:ABC-type phosphate transport system substrate-binding protein
LAPSPPRVTSVPIRGDHARPTIQNIVTKSRIISLLAWIVLFSALAEAKQLAIVADKENSTGNVKTADLANILSGKTKNWADGKPVRIILRDPFSRDMELVFRRVLNMTPDQVHALMQARPGLIVIADSDDAVLRFVSATRGAIGIVDLYSLTKDVNVVKIDGKLPFDVGYLLKGN